MDKIRSVQRKGVMKRQLRRFNMFVCLRKMVEMKEKEGILGNGNTRTEAQGQTGTDDVLVIGNSTVWGQTWGGILLSGRSE